MTFHLPAHTRATIDEFRRRFPVDPGHINVMSQRKNESLIYFKIYYTGNAFPGYPVEVAMTTRSILSKDDEWERIQAIRAYLDRPVDLTTGKPLPDPRQSLAYQGPEDDHKNTIKAGGSKRDKARAADKFLQKTKVLKLGSTLFELTHHGKYQRLAFHRNGRRYVATAESFEAALYLALDMIERQRICEAVRSISNV